MQPIQIARMFIHQNWTINYKMFSGLNWLMGHSHKKRSAESNILYVV